MRALLLSIILLLLAPLINAQPVVGAAQLDFIEASLKQKRLGLVVNQTSRVGDQHLIDALLARGVVVQKIFALEHGIRGNVENGGVVEGGRDAVTGLPVVSHYGGKYGPDAEDLADVDLLVFDIQDVGVRYYTYISSLHYLMQACVDHQVPLLVLDRPNPLIDQVAGPVLEPAFKSFVGMHPIPLVHGLTVGELARMINGEGWLEGGAQCQLSVRAVNHYNRNTRYTLPVRPSPNLPNALSVRLYPSLGLFEGTDVSVGRGTDFPFQVLGHPADSKGLFTFTPESKPGASENPKHKGVMLRGDDLRSVPVTVEFSLSYLQDWYRRLGAQGDAFFTRATFFDKLAGTDKLRKAIVAGQTQAQIEASWADDIARFREQRKPYLLYAEQ